MENLDLSNLDVALRLRLERVGAEAMQKELDRIKAEVDEEENEKLGAEYVELAKEPTKNREKMAAIMRRMKGEA